MSLALGLGLGVSYGGGVGGTPLDIFGSRLMFWYDLSDVSILYQSTDTSTPVTALNDPIGRVSDKSGKGNHATQGTSGSRPLWKQDGNSKYNALFDGTDDSWATSAIDFSASDKVSVFAAVRKLSDAAATPICELSPNSNINNGAFAMFAPNAAAANFSFSSRGSTTVVGATATGYASPVTAVITGLGNTSAPSVAIQVNGVLKDTQTISQGAANYGNYVLYIGRRGGTTLPLNGAIYQLFGVLGAVTAAEIAAAEAFANSKSSAY